MGGVWNGLECDSDPLGGFESGVTHILAAENVRLAIAFYKGATKIAVSEVEWTRALNSTDGQSKRPGI